MDLNWKYVPSETTALPTEPLSLLWARLCIYHSKDHSSLVVENGTRFNGSVHFHSNTNIWAYSMIFLNGPYPASFSLFSSFQNTVDSKQMFNIIINFYRWLDLNRGPLVSEATALPTESQPLPIIQWMFVALFCTVAANLTFSKAITV